MRDYQMSQSITKKSQSLQDIYYIRYWKQKYFQHNLNRIQSKKVVQNITNFKKKLTFTMSDNLEKVRVRDTYAHQGSHLL